MDKALLGAAGVFAVCAELNRRGYMAMPTTRSTKAVDVLIDNHKGVQVKTSTSDSTFITCGGTIGDKNFKDYFVEHVKSDYVLVHWPDPEKKPSFYIVPEQDMVNLLVARLEKWLTEHPNTTWNPAKPGVHQVGVDQLQRNYRSWELLFPSKSMSVSQSVDR